MSDTPQPGSPGSAAPGPTPEHAIPPAGQQSTPLPGPGHEAQRTMPYAPPNYPQRRPETPFKRGFGLGSGAGLGACLALIVGSLVASILGGIVMLGFAAAIGSMSGPSSHSTADLKAIWGPANAKDTLRSIPIRGPIMTNSSDGMSLTTGTYGYEIAKVLDGLTADSAGGVVLNINTPGGSITGSKAISDAVDRYRERTGKKVFAFVEGLSASGGMYAMAGADTIVADHGSVIGSIGVIMGPITRYHNVKATGDVFSGVVSADKIESDYITGGKGKDSGNPYRDMSSEERQEMQAIADEFYAGFVDHVATKRSIANQDIVNKLGAAVFAPKKAIELRLIDDEMGRDEAMKRFAKDAGLDPNSTKLLEAASPGLLSQLFGSNRILGAAPAAQPVGGQPARATATICTQIRTPLAYHGNLESVCG